MNKFLIVKFFNVVIETNIILSLAAVMLSACTALQLGAEPDYPVFLALIFFGTFLAYNIHQLYGLIRKRHKILTGYTKWVHEHKIFFLLLVLLALTGLTGCWLFVKAEVQGMLVLIAVISVLYALPFIRIDGQRKSLRELPGVKIFLIVTVWSAATVVAPSIQLNISVFTIPVMLVLVERIVFLFALAMLFDVRDVETDKRTNLATIPVLYGREKTYLGANLFLILFLAIGLVHYAGNLAFVVPAFLISAAITFVFMNYKRNNTMSYFQYRILDGTLLLQPVLVFIFKYF